MALQLFVGPWPLFSFLIYYTAENSPRTGRPDRRKASTYAHRTSERINAYKHPCLEWDSNQRSQCLNGRREFMPQTARTTEQLQYTKQKLAKKCRIKFNNNFEVIQGHMNLCCRDYQRSHKKDVRNGVNPAR
jgi:hypothetical protein